MGLPLDGSRGLFSRQPATQADVVRGHILHTGFLPFARLDGIYGSEVRCPHEVSDLFLDRYKSCREFPRHVQ